jgi:hypothetical protein
MKEEFKNYACSLSIHELRVVGRTVGVSAASTLRKDALAERIYNILSGEEAACAAGKRGRPPLKLYGGQNFGEMILQMKKGVGAGGTLTEDKNPGAPADIETESKIKRYVMKIKETMAACTDNEIIVAFIKVLDRLG